MTSREPGTNQEISTRQNLRQKLPEQEPFLNRTGNRSASANVLTSNNQNKENQNLNGRSRDGSPLITQSSWNKREGIIRKPAFAKVIDLNCSYLAN